MSGNTRLARTSVLALLLIGVFSPVPAFAYTVRFDGHQVPLSWDGTYFSTSDPLSDWGTGPAGTNAYYSPDPLHGAPGAPSGNARVSPYPFSADDLKAGNVVGFDLLRRVNFFIETHNYDAGSFTACSSDTLCYGVISDEVHNFDTSQFPDVVIHGSYMLFTIDSQGIVTALSSTTTATTTPPAPTGPSSVLFLPGIESSRLYEGNDTVLWEPAGALRPTGDLALDPTGASIGQDIYTKDVIDEAYGNGPNIYKTFLKTLSDLKANTDESKRIADYEAIPYDWRLSLDDILTSGNKIGDKIYYSGTNKATSTPFIIQELKRLASQSKSGKVTIIAHSNGGLLAKELLITHPELNALVDKIIFVDVPQVGTPEALAGLMHGENQGLPFDWVPLLFSKQQARALSNNMPMTYNLLPSQGYFTYVDDAIATFDSATLPDWIAQYGDSIHSNDRLNAFINNTNLDKVLPNSTDTIHPTTGNSTLLSQAQTLHASLDDWQPAPSTQLIQIAGWGVPTLKNISYKKKLVCIQTGGNCVPQYLLDYDINDTIDGDGTVVTPSQLWTSKDLPNVKDYWLDLDKYNKGNIDRKHAGVLEVDQLNNFITDTLNSNLSNLSEYKYLSTTAPFSNNSRLRYSLHSPLTLDLYDSLGNHTGISTTTGQIEEGIPGTYYMEFGDIKYLFTDASSSAHIQMSGYATSTFTFNVDQLQGDTLLASTTFKDIPVTPTTQVSLDVVSDISTLSPMHIDLGDGVVHAITPKLNDVTTLDLTSPEISLAFSTSTNALMTTATDDSGIPTVTSTTTYPVLKKSQSGIATTTLTAVDSSGNTTVFVYTFKYPTKERRIAVTPMSVSYNGRMTKLPNTTAKYKWNLGVDPGHKMFASYIQTISTSTETHFRPKKNVTIIMTKPLDLDDADTDDDADTRATRLKLPGLVIPSLSTQKGKILVSY